MGLEIIENMQHFILDIDFSTVQEKELVDRQTKKSVYGATVPPVTPKA